MSACPIFSPQRVVTYPTLKSFTFPAATNTSRIHVICPWGGRLGYTYTQAVATPDSTTVVLATGDFDDQKAVDLLTPPTGLAGSTQEYYPARAVSCCVEINCTQALATLGGGFRITRWGYGSVQLAAGTAAADFKTIADSLVTDATVRFQPFANISSTRCLRTFMRDRDALDFVNTVPLGDWSTIYGAVGGSLSVATSRGAPFAPIIMLVYGSSLPEYSVTVKGVIQVVPAYDSMLYRLAKPLRPSTPDVESKWWKRQAALSRSGLVITDAGPDRAVGPYLGQTDSLMSKAAKAIGRSAANTAMAVAASGAVQRARRWGGGGGPARRRLRGKPKARPVVKRKK